MNKKVTLGGVAAAIAIAYGGTTWWAGSQIKSRYESEVDILPKQTALVRVVDRQYERGFLGATSTVTLEIGCAPDSAVSAPDAESKSMAHADAAANDDADHKGDSDSERKPPQPLRLTIRDTIHHGPLASGKLAVAVIDSELVLDAQAQAEAKKLFGDAKPLTAHTQVDFNGAFTTDLTVAPIKVAEEGKGRFDWQGLKARVQMNGARTQARYDLTMPGADFSDAERGITVKLGKFVAESDMDGSAGWILATGKSTGRLDTLEFAARKQATAAQESPPGEAPGALPTIELRGIEFTGDAQQKDDLYATSATMKGTGKIGKAAIDRFEITSSARRIHVAGYQKLFQTWMGSSAGCVRGGNQAFLAAMKEQTAELATDLKAMAKYGPEFSLDKLVVESDGKRAELGYTFGMADVNDQDLQLQGTPLIMKRGLFKAHARVPMQWLEKLAEAGAGTGQAPPPELVAGLVERSADKGFVKREGDDVVSEVEYSDGALKLNGQPFGATGR